MDRALRLALLGRKAEEEGVGDGDGTMASSAVTFVREVKRGGRPKQQQQKQKQQRRAEADSRSPNAALEEDAKENGSRPQETG